VLSLEDGLPRCHKVQLAIVALFLKNKNRPATRCRPRSGVYLNTRQPALFKNATGRSNLGRCRAPDSANRTGDVVSVPKISHFRPADHESVQRATTRR